MTGYTVHTGSSEKFSDGWDQIFQQKKTATTKATDKPAAAKKAAKKTAKKSKK